MIFNIHLRFLSLVLIIWGFIYSGIFVLRRMMPLLLVVVIT